ncbi:MAG TPA: class III extradiol ring-cleavage dioxygenase [Steroidobacteraceae bacterium]
MTTRLPTFYIPHGGGPCFFMDWPGPPPNPWTPLAEWLRHFSAALPQPPRAVLVISGHWEAEPISVNVQRRPPLLFDYYGFPDHTYQLKYPAPGDPLLAGEVRSMLGAAGIATGEERERGLDHGVFVPFLLLYPNADMPIVQLSLKQGLSAPEHLRLGAALAPLRDQGVLIVGSGMSFHNLRVRSMENALIPGSQLFDDWLGHTVCQSDIQARNAALANWSQAPAARYAHPREEHLLPLMVAAGAAGDDVGIRTFNDVMMGWRISGFRFG